MMKTITKATTAITLASMLALTSGCATQRALVNHSSSEFQTSTDSQAFFIGGIGQEKSVDAASVCGGPSKVSTVETTQTAKDVLLSVVTFSIYTPRTANVYCR